MSLDGAQKRLLRCVFRRLGVSKIAVSQPIDTLSLFAKQLFYFVNVLGR